MPLSMSLLTNLMRTFVDPPLSYRSFITRDNVLVCKTFSKSLALPGLRSVIVLVTLMLFLDFTITPFWGGK